MNLWGWWRNRAQREVELEEEIQAHLRMAEQERVARGEASPEARTNARREFGNLLMTKEATRAQWGWVWLDQLVMDIRYVLRTLRRSPGFTAVAVLSLALGIGANTAIYSLFYTIMLRQLPVSHPEQLVELVRNSPDELHWAGYWAWEQYEYLRDHNHVF